MRRGTAMLVAGTCAGAVVAVLGVAAAVRPPDPAGPLPPAGPSLITSVATTATAAPPERAVEQLRGGPRSPITCTGSPVSSSPAVISARPRSAAPHRRPGC
ncbi:hypothetical protein [Amycolatopsis sp. NPDC051102]|uniref:hypothetical protein n=1 Tax=Amycolatopsis sp. NPDC051102 TaxID=3155163 RepID=UPI0034492D71